MFTGLGLWNQDARLENISLSPGNVILYAGANTAGQDGVYFMQRCPDWWAVGWKLSYKSVISASLKDVC